MMNDVNSTRGILVVVATYSTEKSGHVVTFFLQLVMVVGFVYFCCLVNFYICQ